MVPANPRPPGKWPLKGRVCVCYTKAVKTCEQLSVIEWWERERERERERCKSAAL